MEHSTKNKLFIIERLLILGFTSFICIVNNSMLLWQTVILIALWTLITFVNIYRDSKNFTLNQEILIVRQMFRKEQQYDLKIVSGWSENNYQLLGFTIGRKIVLKTVDGIRLDLSNRNSREFEKISEYLNETMAEVYENYR